MTTYVAYIIVVALLTAFVIILAKKWGITEMVQIHGNDFFSKLASCDFCMSYWVSLVISIIAVIVTGDWTLIFLPFFVTPLSRYIL